MYYHGVRIQENPTSISAPVYCESGVPVVFGTAPINLADDPDNATNKLFLCNTFAEAKAALGYSDDYDSYTLCQAMDAFFKAFAVAPVVLCNVLDPATHKDSYEETLTVTSGQATGTERGVLTGSLTVKSDDQTLTDGTDYTVAFDDDGYPVFTVITDGITSLTVSGSKLDPSKVTASAVVGAYSATSGEETGIELVRQVYPKFDLVPNLLLAPGWSEDPTVGLALSEKCNSINGCFTCECIVDIDTTKATKYTDVETVKNESGYLNDNMICVWPRVKYAGQNMAASALLAAETCNLDYENGSVPNLYPSNKAIKASAAVLKDGTEVNLDQNQANELNAAGVVTILYLGGVYKAWGNNMAGYPGTTDPKDRWIGCRRFFSWWGNRFITTYTDKVDDPTNYRLIESIVDSENVFGNSLVSQGKCAGARISYSKDDNPIANVLDGKVVFRQYLAPYPPAEDILNILEFDPSMLEAELGGE